MYAIKTEVTEPAALSWCFEAQKTMYCGRKIAAGDLIFVFASEIQGGRGLLAKGRVISALALARHEGAARQTPRVSLSVERVSWARRSLGRAELLAFSAWDDGRPETELNFKLYRQATNKIVGISAAAALLLQGCC